MQTDKGLLIHRLLLILGLYAYACALPYHTFHMWYIWSMVVCSLADCSAAGASSKEPDNGWLLTRAWRVRSQWSISSGRYCIMSSFECTWVIIRTKTDAQIHKHCLKIYSMICRKIILRHKLRCCKMILTTWLKSVHTVCLAQREIFIVWLQEVSCVHSNCSRSYMQLPRTTVCFEKQAKLLFCTSFTYLFTVIANDVNYASITQFIVYKQLNCFLFIYSTANCFKASERGS